MKHKKIITTILKKIKVAFKIEYFGYILLCIFFALSCVAQAQSTLNPDTWIAPPLPPINMSLFPPASNNLAQPGKVLVFVSSSMPQVSVKQWLIQAEAFEAAVVIQGLVNHSLSDTKMWMQHLVNSEEAEIGIDINPVAFEQYGIAQVPAVVVTQTSFSSTDCDEVAPFDVVCGNSSLEAALKRIANEGEVGNLTAKMHLARQRKSDE